MKAFRPEILYEEVNLINDAMTTVTRPPVVEDVSQLKSNASVTSNDNIDIKSGGLTSMAGEFRTPMMHSNFAPTQKINLKEANTELDQSSVSSINKKSATTYIPKTTI